MTGERFCECGGHALHGRGQCRGCLYWRHIGRLEDAFVSLEKACFGCCPMTADQRVAWDALSALVERGVDHE